MNSQWRGALKWASRSRTKASSSSGVPGLGASATLVLMNGHRLAGAGNEGLFVDVSNLPLDSEGNVKFPAITQEGQAVFRWAVFEMAKVAQQALDAAGITPDDLDVFIPHQANMRIIDSMVKTLKLPEHVTVARDVETTGNTSAASIPLAMERLLATGEAKSGDTALVIGFGAGLVYAATVVTLP